MSSTSIRPSNALASSRQMRKAAAVFLPLRGLQQMPRILMERGCFGALSLVGGSRNVAVPRAQPQSQHFQEIHGGSDPMP